MLQFPWFVTKASKHVTQENASIQFQSGNRDIDISLGVSYTTSMSYKINDFIGPVKPFEIYLTSGAPPMTSDYLTIFRPFDQYVWALLVVSILAVSATLIFINKMWCFIPNIESCYEKTAKETPFEGRIE